MSSIDIKEEVVSKTICGIQFAPLNEPLDRRLELLAATFWYGIYFVCGPICYVISFLIIVFAWDWLRFLFALYLLFMYIDLDSHAQGATRQPLAQWVRDSALMRYLCGYFSVKLVKTADLDPTKNYLFCTFPHGILPIGVFSAFTSNSLDFPEKFPGLSFKILTMDSYFYVPLFREVLLALGMASVDIRSVEYLLKNKPTRSEGINNMVPQGRASVLYVGGASEALKSKPETYKISILQKKGFIKVAFKHGTPVVPVITFGETNVYDQLQFPEGSFIRNCQELFKNIFGFAPIILNGRGFFQYSFGVLPRRTSLITVVGAPIEIPKISDPSDEHINIYHARFCKKLVELFETHKGKYLKYPEKTVIIPE